MADVLKPTGKLDLAAASNLHGAIMAHTEGDLELDLSGVNQIGALCLQICVSAAKTLNARGNNMQITHASEAVEAQFLSMGMTPATLPEAVQ